MGQNVVVEPVSPEKISQFLEDSSLHKNTAKIFSKLEKGSWLDVKWIAQSEIIKLVPEEFIVGKIAPYLLSKKNHKPLRKAERLDFLTKLEESGAIWGWKYSLTQSSRFNSSATHTKLNNFLIKYPQETTLEFKKRIAKVEVEVEEIKADAQKLVQYYFCGPTLWYREGELNKSAELYQTNLEAVIKEYLKNFSSKVRPASIIKWGIANNAWLVIPGGKRGFFGSLFDNGDLICERGLLQSVSSFQETFEQVKDRVQRQARELRLWEVVRANVNNDARVIGKENQIKELREALDTANKELSRIRTDVEEEVKAHVKPLVDNDDAMEL